MKDYKIYIVKNKFNDKIYIGQTCQKLYMRKKGHFSDINRGSNIKFHKAIRKHGKKNFEWLIIENNLTHCEACELEEYYIRKYNSINEGYNSMSTTNGVSEETRKKIGEKHKGKIISKEQREKIRKTLKENYIKENHNHYIDIPKHIKEKIIKSYFNNGLRKTMKMFSCSNSKIYSILEDEGNKKRIKDDIKLYNSKIPKGINHPAYKNVSNKKRKEIFNFYLNNSLRKTMRKFSYSGTKIKSIISEIN